MDTMAKQSFIQRIALENLQDPQGTRILWSRHAITELVNDRLGRQQVERALQQCQVIEDYPELHRPLPDCLALAELDEREPIHVVVAIDAVRERILLVTVYRPSEKEWEHDWRTRKQ